MFYIFDSTSAAWPNLSGIYALRNLKNDKVYVGSTLNFRMRWADHRCRLRGSRHTNAVLAKAFDKYGSTSFRFEVLEVCSEAQLLEREMHWISVLRSDRRLAGYNLLEHDGRGRFRLTAETRSKIRNALKGRRLSTTHCANIAAGGLGRVQSLESRQRMSAAKQGAKFSARHRKNLRLAQLGKKRSVAHRLAISAGLRKSARQRAL